MKIPKRIESSNWIRYFYDQKLHGEDGPAIIWHDGSEEWYFEGELHRLDGPAITRPDGTWRYYFNGKIHREDGPAIKYSTGEYFYWLNGEYLSQDIVNHWINENNISIPFSEENRIEFIMRFG